MILRKNKNTNIFNHISTDWLIISLLNTVIENNYGLENRMWRQTNGWVTCAKPSRQNTDPGVSHTFSRRFLNQNYPKYISDVVSKILEEKKNYQMFYLNLWSPEIGFPVVKVENHLLPIFLVFHRTDFGGFLVCCYKAIQQLNGVEKNSVAISLMLNHNLTELLPQLNVK